MVVNNTKVRYQLLIFIPLLISTLCVLLAVISVRVFGDIRTYDPPRTKAAFPLRLQSTFQVQGEILSTPATADQIVVVRTANGLSAVQPESGKVLWETGIEGRLGGLSPTRIANELVYTASTHGIWAVDLQTGQVKWNVRGDGTNGWKTPSPPEIKALVSGLVIFHYPYHLVALDGLTGDFVWNVPAGRTDAVTSSELEIFDFPEDNLIALDPQTGAQLWSLTLDRGPRQAQYQDGKIFILGVRYSSGNSPSQAQTLIAIDGATRSEAWRKELPQDIQAFSVQENLVLVSTENYLVSLDAATGQQAWSSYLKADDYQQAVHIADVVYVRGSISKNIYALSASKGSYLGQLETGLKTLLFYRGNEAWPVTDGAHLIFPVVDKLYVYQQDEY